MSENENISEIDPLVKPSAIVANQGGASGEANNGDNRNEQTNAADSKKEADEIRSLYEDLKKKDCKVDKPIRGGWERITTGVREYLFFLSKSLLWVSGTSLPLP